MTDQVECLVTLALFVDVKDEAPKTKEIVIALEDAEDDGDNHTLGVLHEQLSSVKLKFGVNTVLDHPAVRARLVSNKSEATSAQVAISTPKGEHVLAVPKRTVFVQRTLWMSLDEE